MVTQMLPSLEVERATFALQEGTFVPSQAKPSEVLENGFAKFRSATVAIQIFDSQNQSPVPRAAALLRAPESQGMAGMQIAGGRRRETAAIRNFRFQIQDFKLPDDAFQSEISTLKASHPKRLLLFDIDGTLIDSGGAGIQALKDVLQTQFGISDDLRGVEIAGQTDTGIVHQILRKQNITVDDKTTAAFLDLYVECLARELPQRKGTILPGVEELLGRLRARSQNVLGLLTGNVKRGAKLKLSHYGIWNFFEFGAFADDHHDRNELGPFAQRRAREKHAIDFAAAEIDVIGDTPHDIACGKAIGARTIAVTTGNFTRAQLAEYQPDRIVDDFSEVAPGDDRSRVVAARNRAHARDRNREKIEHEHELEIDQSGKSDMLCHLRWQKLNRASCLSKAKSTCTFRRRSARRLRP